MGYSTKRSNRHFLRAMLSRSISSVNHTTQRPEFSIPALCSPATGRWASGLHRNTNACPRAVERVLTAEMRSKVPVALHAASPPTSADGIEKYLSSGMIRGIGPAYAKKLLRAFGEKVFDIIEATPDRLREVDGIGPVRANRITAAWAEQKAVRKIMVFLHSHGVGTAKTYGPDAIQVMTENPYRLARDIRGIGFKTADAIAMKLGIEKTALVRVRAGISYALTEAMDEGHCGLPTEELIPLAEKLLEVPQELIRTALDLELQQGTVVADRVGETPCVFGRLASRGAHHGRAS